MKNSLFHAKKHCIIGAFGVVYLADTIYYFMEESNQGGGMPFDLSELTDFQFGPAWARKGAAQETPLAALPPRSRDHRPAPRRRDGERREGAPRRNDSSRHEGGHPFNRTPREGAQVGSRHGRERRPSRAGDTRGERPQRELPQPAEGYRVELRPANGILEVFSKEIQKLKRALPLLDLARVVMAGKERYDVVFMKLENGSTLIHSTKGDNACWLTEAEAVSYLWKAPWFAELYATERVETEAPKGSFSGVAVVDGALIGPANWHGYQASLMNLYRTRYSHLPLEVFKARVKVDKTEETVSKWLEEASHKTVWKPVYEGAAEASVLEDERAVEADFRTNAYSKVYEQVDKIFVNGATPRERLTPGIAAHVAILADKTRRFPQMLIPNLCHGLARHHMPIYKWQGNHFTGPSRVRAIPADTVLADRMAAIVTWAKEHSGSKLEAMFAELSGVPAGTDEESAKLATDAHAPYVADTLWLLEQGFLVVTSDNALWYPKGETAPAPTRVEATKGKPRHAKGKGKGNKPQQQKKVDKPAAPAAPAPETPSEAPAPEDTPEEESPAPEAAPAE